MAFTRNELKDAEKLFGHADRKTLRELRTWAWRSRQIKEAADISDVHVLSMSHGFPFRRFVVAGSPSRIAAFVYRLGGHD